MIKEIILPEISENIDKGDVVKVLVKAGDQIEVDQPVIELETDKAMFEVPSTESGVVKETKVKEGDSVKVGGVILTIDTNGKKSDEKKDKSKPGKKESKTEKKDGKKESGKEEESRQLKQTEKEEMEKEEKREKEDEEEPKKEIKKVEKESEEKKEPDEEKKDEKEKSKPETEEEPEERKSTEKDRTVSAPASPSIRRLARELGADIHEVPGSGPSGRISEDDVKKYVKSIMQSEGGSVPLSHKPLPDFSRWGEIETEKMSKVRKITAESMTYAWTTIPHVTQFDKTDITSMEEFRKKHGKKIEAGGGKLTITSILLKICAEALKKFPQFNSSLDPGNNEIIYKKYFNIGIAVDTERGLLVPVIKDVNKKNLTEISKELTDLSEKARNKKITPEEMEGGNFTITNLGGIGGTNFTPIVYSPQVAILAVSRAEMMQVYKDGNFSPRLMAPLALSYDHRVIDGADAARFLRWICETLEYPLMKF
jgi:pyruvate dehydrogenase E2 component (dihydrolipoamide acetyltransferase)